MDARALEAVTSRAYLSIGDVLTLLRREFPDVTISKIRFLESQGLVDPERTPSGYRKFYEDDVERLRWVLRQQREHFLPLKVIKGRLEKGDPEEPAVSSSDNGAETRHAEVPAGAGGAPAAAPDRGAVRVEAGAPTRVGPREGHSAEGAAPGALSLPGLLTEPVGGERGQSAQAGGVGGRGAGPLAPTESAPSSGAALGALPARRAPGEREPRTEEPVGRMAHPVHGDDRAARRPDVRPVPAPTDARRERGDASSAREPGPRMLRTPDQPGAGAREDARSAGRKERPEAVHPVSAFGGVGMTASELAEECGLETSDIEELESYGLLVGKSVGGVCYYDDDSVTIASLAASFAQHGVEARHLRIHLLAAQREAGLVEQVVLPLLKQRNPASRQRATETVQELTRLGQELRVPLVNRSVRDLLGG